MRYGIADYDYSGPCPPKLFGFLILSPGFSTLKAHGTLTRSVLDLDQTFLWTISLSQESGEERCAAEGEEILSHKRREHLEQRTVVGGVRGQLTISDLQAVFCELLQTTTFKLLFISVCFVHPSNVYEEFG